MLMFRSMVGKFSYFSVLTISNFPGHLYRFCCFIFLLWSRRACLLPIADEYSTKVLYAYTPLSNVRPVGHSLALPLFQYVFHTALLRETCRVCSAFLNVLEVMRTKAREAPFIRFWRNYTIHQSNEYRIVERPKHLPHTSPSQA